MRNIPPAKPHWEQPKPAAPEGDILSTDGNWRRHGPNHRDLPASIRRLPKPALLSVLAPAYFIGLPLWGFLIGLRQACFEFGNTWKFH